MATPIQKIKRSLALISKKASAQNDWDSWASGYNFSFKDADSYDLANARSRANTIIKKYNLKEAKLQEGDLTDRLSKIHDPYERNEMIFNWVKKGQIGLMDFNEIIKYLASDMPGSSIDASEVNIDKTLPAMPI